MKIDAAIRAQIDELLNTGRTASLATVDDEGWPHAVNVQFVHDERLHVYFVSSAGSAHGRHVVVRPEVAVAIYAHDDRPEQIHGLQMHGHCRPVRRDERLRALARYVEKFPFVAQPPLAALVAQQTLYEVAPTWVRWIDNRRGFGFKVEMVCAGEG